MYKVNVKSNDNSSYKVSLGRHVDILTTDILVTNIHSTILTQIAVQDYPILSGNILVGMVRGT